MGNKGSQSAGAVQLSEENVWDRSGWQNVPYGTS